MKGMTRRERGISDRQEILDRCKVVHLAMTDGDAPYVVPRNHGYTMDDAGTLPLYIHGAKTGHKLDPMRQNPKAEYILCWVLPKR